MSNTGLVRTKPRGVMDLTQEEYERLGDACATLALGGTMFLAKGLVNVAQAKACGLIAISYGYDPVLATQWMWVVEGRITFHYRWKLAMAKDKVPTLKYQWTVDTEKCTGWMQRDPNDTKHEYTYTMADAVTAGVVKDGSAWKKNPKDMLTSKWVDRILVMAAPDLILGPPAQDDAVVMEDEAPAPEPGKPVSEAVVVETTILSALGESTGATPADPPAAANESPSTPAPPVKPPTAKELAKAFRARAKELNFNTKDPERMKGLLSDLLSIKGLESPDQLTRDDWAKATELLDKKYPKGAPAAAAPATDTGSKGAPEAPAAAMPDELDEKTVAAVQSQSPDYLLAISQELERAWKQEGSVVKQHKGNWWFINDVILKGAGHKKDGKSLAMCLGKSDHEDRNLGPSQLAVLSVAVLAALSQARNGGRPVVAQSA